PAPVPFPSCPRCPFHQVVERFPFSLPARRAGAPPSGDPGTKRPNAAAIPARGDRRQDAARFPLPPGSASFHGSPTGQETRVIALKFETRISKSEANLKSEIQTIESTVLSLSFAISCFEFVSDFEIRISNLVVANRTTQIYTTHIKSRIFRCE